MSTPDKISETEEHAHAPKNLTLALIVICTAQLMVVLDATIVNIALPEHPGGPRLHAGQPAVGADRLHAGLRRLPAARWSRR